MVIGAGISKWLALAALVVLLWVARGVLPPFIVAGILAYILSPLVDQLAARFRIVRVCTWRSACSARSCWSLIALIWLLGARLTGEVRSLAREGPSIIETVVDHATGGVEQIDLFGRASPRASSVDGSRWRCATRLAHRVRPSRRCASASS